MYPKYSKKAFDYVVKCWWWDVGVLFWTKAEDCQPNMGHKKCQRPSIAKQIRTVKKVVYAIFFTYKGPAIQILVPKGRTVTGKFYKNVVLRKLKNFYKSLPGQD